ncbi:MAG: TIGR04338 family metallohydrolase [Candidatus Nanopelagicales bacterium]
MTDAEIDRFRAAVYQAEDQWSSALDRGGTVDFFGSSLTLPTQIRFGSLTDVGTYVAHVCANVDVSIPRVRHRKGGSRAHYERVRGECVIAIPMESPWAMRESVVLHEISHHVCAERHDSLQHDRNFTVTMVEIVRLRLGDEAALLLRTGYQAAKIPA